MKLDPTTHNPEQAHILGLCLRTGLELSEIAAKLKVDQRILRQWLSGSKSSQIPYCAQFALEALVAEKEAEE